MAEPPSIDHKSLAPPPLPSMMLPAATVTDTAAPTATNLPPSGALVADNVAFNTNTAAAAPQTTPQTTPPITSPSWNHGDATWDGAGIATAGPPSLPWESTHAPLLQPEAEVDPEDEPLFDGFTIFTALPSWMVSTLLHLTLMLAMAFLFFPLPDAPRPFDLVLGEDSGPAEEIDELDELDTVDIESLVEESLEDEAIELAEEEIEPMENPEDESLVDALVDMSEPLINEVSLLDNANPVVTDLGEEIFGPRQTKRSNEKPVVAAGGGFGLRTAQSRMKQVLRDGGTEASEQAVARALKWLAKEQNNNGSWDLAAGEAGVTTDGRGRFAATGLALLPFLGAGHTHKDGEYKYVVDRGLNYLIKEMKRDGNGLDGLGRLTDGYGNYYSHGLCTIAMCEAYAMTRDNRLRLPAQQLINEIVDAQHPAGGGWRYRRREPGDTSVLGWQLMALKSGKLAYLNVPDKTFQGASRFLDSVQTDYGSAYGYTSPGTRSSTSAVGLLSRMYLGWDRDRKGIEKGVNRISKVGPDKDEIYFSYYATQILHHYGGPKWDKWNASMRDSLVNSQSRGGRDDGSWQLRASHHRSRIYCTSMATMILEVYYRHLPLYGKQAADGTAPF